MQCKWSEEDKQKPVRPAWPVLISLRGRNSQGSRELAMTRGLAGEKAQTFLCVHT